MKVFLLRQYDYELQQCLGVFATRAAAEAAIRPDDDAITFTYDPESIAAGYADVAWQAEVSLLGEKNLTGWFSSYGETQDEARQGLLSQLSELTVEEWTVQGPQVTITIAPLQPNVAVFPWPPNADRWPR